MLSGLSGATGLMGSSTLIPPVPCSSASCANGLNNLRIRNDLSGHGKSNLSNLERAKLGACSVDHEDAGEGNLFQLISRPFVRARQAKHSAFL